MRPERGQVRRMHEGVRLEIIPAPFCGFDFWELPDAINPAPIGAAIHVVSRFAIPSSQSAQATLYFIYGGLQDLIAP